MIETAYAAGFFDGEGCIGIYPKVGSYRLTLAVAQTETPVLYELKDRWKGELTGPYIRGNAKPIWTWRVLAAQAELFLVDVLPFLIVKKERALLALEFRELFKGDNVLGRGRALGKPEKIARIKAEREVYYWRMKELNKRGV